MIHVNWVPSTSDVSPLERLQEAERIRQKCRSDRHLMGEDGYAKYMQYAARMEERAHKEADLVSELDDWAVKSTSD